MPKKRYKPEEIVAKRHQVQKNGTSYLAENGTSLRAVDNFSTANIHNAQNTHAFVQRFIAHHPV